MCFFIYVKYIQLVIKMLSNLNSNKIFLKLTSFEDAKISLNFWLRFNNLTNNKLALAGVAQWIEHQPMDQEVAGSIPSQGTCLECLSHAPQLFTVSLTCRCVPLLLPFPFLSPFSKNK